LIHMISYGSCACTLISSVAPQHIKDGDHICINCPKCYLEAKKKKKLVQLLIENCKCCVACKEVDVDKLESYEVV
jgi:hypothetical protein